MHAQLSVLFVCLTVVVFLCNFNTNIYGVLLREN